jgi:hypothetical protein
MRFGTMMSGLALIGLTACTTSGGGTASGPTAGGTETAGPGKVRYVATTCPFAADVSLKITQASSYGEGIAAEYDWIRRNLPGWSRDSQALMGGPGGRSYDVLTLVKGGQKKTVCFDITDVWKLMPG